MKKSHVRIAVLALVVAAGALGAGAVAFARQGSPAISPRHQTSLPRSTPSPASVAPLACSSSGLQASLEGTEGAAGTIRSVWRLQNVAGRPCRSFGYPALAVHGTGGWVDLQMHQGGFADIDAAPRHLVVGPGRSMSFATYWSDATTDQGSCTQFDQVRVTLPGDGGSSTISASGCVTTTSPVDVGPVATKAPSL